MEKNEVWGISFDESLEMKTDLVEKKKEQDALAILRADYQWIVCCQQMDLSELKQEIIDNGPFPGKRLPEWNDPDCFQDKSDSMHEHALRRYRQALIVYEARTKEPVMSGMVAIKELVNDTSFDRSAILKAAQRGVFKGRTCRSGAIWLIDTSHISYRDWEQKHRQRGHKHD